MLRHLSIRPPVQMILRQLLRQHPLANAKSRYNIKQNAGMHQRCHSRQWYFTPRRPSSCCRMVLTVTTSDPVYPDVGLFVSVAVILMKRCAYCQLYIAASRLPINLFVRRSVRSSALTSLYTATAGEGCSQRWYPGVQVSKRSGSSHNQPSI